MFDIARTDLMFLDGIKVAFQLYVTTAHEIARRVPATLLEVDYHITGALEVDIRVTDIPLADRQITITDKG